MVMLFTLDWGKCFIHTNRTPLNGDRNFTAHNVNRTLKLSLKLISMNTITLQYCKQFNEQIDLNNKLF